MFSPQFLTCCSHFITACGGYGTKCYLPSPRKAEKSIECSCGLWMFSFVQVIVCLWGWFTSYLRCFISSCVSDWTELTWLAGGELRYLNFVEVFTKATGVRQLLVLQGVAQVVLNLVIMTVIRVIGLHVNAHSQLRFDSNDRRLHT